MQIGKAAHIYEIPEPIPATVVMPVRQPVAVPERETVKVSK